MKLRTSAQCMYWADVGALTGLICNTPTVWKHFNHKRKMWNLFNYSITTITAVITLYVSCLLGAQRFKLEIQSYIYNIKRIFYPWNYDHTDSHRITAAAWVMAVSQSFKFLSSCTQVPQSVIPAVDTWRNNNAVITSKRRCDVILTC